MTDERLAEIEASAACGTENGDAKEMSRVCAFDVPELVAEVRRLRAICGRAHHSLTPLPMSHEDIKRGYTEHVLSGARQALESAQP